jgi:diguanylate cyclase (GGDEF)-like protein
MSWIIRSAFKIADRVANVSDSANATKRARIRALVIWTILAVPLGVAMILGKQLHNLVSPVSVAISVGFVGLTVSIIHLRLTQRLSDSSLIFVMSVLIGLGLAAWFVEVPDLLPLIFLAVTPVYYGLMVNWKRCLAYTIVVAIYFFALSIWAYAFKQVPLDIVMDLAGCGLAAFGSGVSTVAYSYVTERATNKLKRQNDEIGRLAFRDAMTGIANRRAFNERLSEAVDHQSGELLVAIDLNRFKAINDRHGHEVGDEVLCELTHRLERAAPKGAVVYRVGGDEFAIIANKKTIAADELARRLCDTSEHRYETSAGELAVKISVGVSSPKQSLCRLRDLYREADIALFEAKKAPHSDWCLYSDDLGAAKNREARLSDLLKEAIISSRIEVAFQPQFCVSENAVIGVEALARWETTEFGKVSPGEFVPIADQSGLIVDLDRCVFRQAILTAQAWLQPHQRLAVNVSGKTLLSEGFVEFAEATIAQSALAFEQCTVEITETEIIDNQADAKIVCDQLRALGVSIALHDFGTGYSSLSYLSTLPIDTLKIDRSFVQAANAQSNLKIVKSIIGLAQSMGLNLLVEGVERGWQLDAVVELGCDRVQGFYFSRPLSAEQCAELVRAAPSQQLSERNNSATKLRERAGA